MKTRLIPLFMAAIILLSGCGAMTAEDFYALPQLSDTYISLQNEINALLEAGAEYASPASGQYRQAVQLEDIDGDGVKEALVFTNLRGSAKPLKIHVFRNENDVYEEVAVIEGEGTGVESVSYVDMDRDGVKEIVVGWRIASGMNILSVYSMTAYTVENLFSSEYSMYLACDLDGDVADEIVVLHLEGDGGTAEVFNLRSGGEMVSVSCELSEEVRSVSRMRRALLTDGAPAVLVESYTGTGGLVTDILISDGSLVVNLETGSGENANKTLRQVQIWCRDINGDDIIDVPWVEALPVQAEASSLYYLTRWYDYSSGGKAEPVLTTYINVDESWYLTIPDGWIGKITARDQNMIAGERAVVFSTVSEDGTTTDFLVIYTITGDNREERASSGRRFILRHEEDRVYAAAILPSADGAFPIEVNRDLVRESFDMLYSEWITGEG